MKLSNKSSKTLVACIALAALTVPLSALPMSSAKRLAQQRDSGEVAVAYPWAFQNGTDTSRRTAMIAVEEVARRAGYQTVPRDDARGTWKNGNFAKKSFGRLPSKKDLLGFGQAVHASKILYGSITWNTRSIWVNLGPKTISTATVDTYVFDVKANRVVYRQLGTTGRSDERSNIYKLAADVLITPLVTAVSGGPATPREQRAVQIALGNAYRRWVRSGDSAVGNRPR